MRNEAGQGLRLPGWVAGVGVDGSTDAALFAAGAALSCLQPLAMGARSDAPMALLRDRLAMRAALVAMALTGRSEREAELRDEVYLLRPGEQPGPGGAALARWRAAVARPLKRRAAGPARRAAETASVFDPPEGSSDAPDRASAPSNGAATPLDAAAAALGETLTQGPRDVVAALIAADAALARALRWPHLLPLLGLRLRRADLAREGEALRDACARAVVAASGEALRAAADAARAQARLMAVAPRLRARASDAAVAVFLSQAAVAPSLDLAPRVRGSSVAMTDRAARRLCDRLVALGAARELTGRGWSRLYGL